MAGGLNAHTNPFVEAWGLRREHIEKTFRWTPRSLGIIALTGVVFPLWVYKISVSEFVRAPKRPGAPRDERRRTKQAQRCALPCEP